MMRKIDASKFCNETIPYTFGPAAQLQWLAIAQLVVDDAYQRPIASQGEKTVRSIIKKFDWRMFAPVIVSPIAGGLFAIVDGQHRTTAAAACGHESVPCAVIMADQRTQAVAFGAINGVVTQVSRHQQFKAALAAGDPAALRIKGVADKAAVKILYYNTAASNLKPNETCALETIRRGVTVHGDTIMTITMRAIATSAGTLGGYLRAPIIKAVFEVLSDHKEWARDDRLIAAFQSIDLVDALCAASAQAAARRGLFSGDLLQATIINHLEKSLDVVGKAA